MQKGQALIFILIGILVIAVVGGAYFLGKQSIIKPSPNPVVTSQTPQPTVGAQINNKVNINTAKVGDKIEEMTITSMQPFNSSQGGISNSNAKINFKGKVTITGTISCISDELDPGLNHVAMNNLDSQSKIILPSLQDETNLGYIDFNNPTSNLAKSLCQTYNGKQTSLVIDNYTINSYPGAMVFNTADLSN